MPGFNLINWIRAAAGANDEELTATGEAITLQAAAGEGAKVRRFTSVAYSGGLLLLPQFNHPAVVDLETLTIAAQSTPVFREHDPNRVVGNTTSISNDKKSLRVEGQIILANSHAAEVLDGAENGFAWQQSIGARFDRTRVKFVKPGEVLQANGRTFQGPVFFVQGARLKEISFVALGADEETSAALAAAAHSSEKGTSEMKFEEWLQANGWNMEQLTQTQLTSLRAAWKASQGNSDDGAAAAAGAQAATVQPAALQATGQQMGTDGASANGVLELRQDQVRIRKISNLCARFSGINEITLDDGTKVDPYSHAIEAGWQSDQLEVYLHRANLPKAPAVHVSADLQASERASVWEVAVLQATGYREQDLTEQYDDRILTAAQRKFRGRMGLQELFLEAAFSNGYHGGINFRSHGREILEAAFSSNDISGILSNTANKFIRVGFEKVESTWRSIATIKPVTDFKEITSYSLTGDLQYEKIGPTGEIKHGKLGEESYTNKADTYAKMLSITRQDIINDDLGALEGAPRRLGRGGALKFNDVFWTEYMNNSSFFTSGRSNYISGASTVLSVDSLTEAEAALMNQTDPDGKPLAAMPAILLVPNALYVTGTQLMNSTELRGQASKSPSANPHAGKFAVVRSSYLSNAAYTGYSTTAWYLLCDPEDIPVIEAVFLNGQQLPTIETSEAVFNQLGIEMRGYHDFGVSKQEYRGGVMSKGAA